MKITITMDEPGEGDVNSALSASHSEILDRICTRYLKKHIRINGVPYAEALQSHDETTKAQLRLAVDELINDSLIDWLTRMICESDYDHQTLH